MRRPIPTENLAEDTRRLMDVLNDEPDLACVVIAAAFLDTTLSNLLETKFRQSSVSERLLAPNGALGTFGARTDLAYALELISKAQHEDLRLLARIRNRFAHSHLLLTFTDVGVQDRCNHLHEWRFLLVGEDEDIPTTPTDEQRRIRARNQFKLTVVFLANRILLTSLGLKQKRTSEKSYGQDK